MRQPAQRAVVGPEPVQDGKARIDVTRRAGLGGDVRERHILAVEGVIPVGKRIRSTQHSYFTRITISVWSSNVSVPSANRSRSWKTASTMACGDCCQCRPRLFVRRVRP